MATLNDLISLAKADGGKFFVVDETGEPSLVIMGVEDYQRLLLGKLQKQIVDVENINKEILRAQIEETESFIPEIEKPLRQNTGPRLRQEAKAQQPDLRAEVIDPSFDFEAPKLNDDEF